MSDDISLILTVALLVAVYFTMGISVYKLCRSSDIGSLDSVPMWVIFVWPIILIVGAFVSSDEGRL